MGISRTANSRKFQSRYGNSRLPFTEKSTERPRSNDVAEQQAKILQGRFGNLRSPSKEMANLTGLNERACRNQIAGVNCMNLADFFNACQAIPELALWGEKMMGLSGARQVNEVNQGMQAITLRIEANGVKVTQ